MKSDETLTTCSFGAKNKVEFLLKGTIAANLVENTKKVKMQFAKIEFE